MGQGDESLGILEVATVENVGIQILHYLGHCNSEGTFLKDGTPLKKGYWDYATPLRVFLQSQSPSTFDVALDFDSEVNVSGIL